ncbi:MAG: 30S ribosomal protein S7 [Acidimicrobiales bacterium]|jgi:small subunit ribosomal protein S7|nr:30S ribosomal protein S7 [Nitrososphaerota archaeon]
MPRKGPVERRELAPDPIYHSVLVTQFINKILTRGKKTLAQGIVYGAMDEIRERTGSDPLTVLKRAVDNTKPELEVRSRRVGGSTYQVPIEVKSRRSMTLSIRWIVSYSRNRRERTMVLRLANEILDASSGIGASVKRKDDLHKMAESNRAFAHYRW